MTLKSIYEQYPWLNLVQSHSGIVFSHDERLFSYMLYDPMSFYEQNGLGHTLAEKKDITSREVFECMYSLLKLAAREDARPRREYEIAPFKPVVEKKNQKIYLDFD